MGFAIDALSHTARRSAGHCFVIAMSCARSRIMQHSAARSPPIERCPMDWILLSTPSIAELIEPYFSAVRMRALEPRCRAVVRELMVSADEIEVMSQLAEEFALRVQCIFLDWPLELHSPLRDWVRKNHEAIRSRDRAAISAVASEFDTHIRAVLLARRAASGSSRDDVASQLLKEQVRGRNLTDDEIVMILRNWTVGELGIIAASIGILVCYLATRPMLQSQLLQSPSMLPPAIDEILRIEAPLLTSRRMTTTAVDHDGLALPSRGRVTLMWASANRDETVCGEPDEFPPRSRSRIESAVWRRHSRMPRGTSCPHGAEVLPRGILAGDSWLRNSLRQAACPGDFPGRRLCLGLGTRAHVSPGRIATAREQGVAFKAPLIPRYP